MENQLFEYKLFTFVNTIEKCTSEKYTLLIQYLYISTFSIVLAFR